MNNLEQIRARNVLNFANSGTVSGKKGGEVIKKISPMILNNGLLATVACSFDEGKEAWKQVFDAVAIHLSDPDIAAIPCDKNDRNGLMTFLTGETATSKDLQLATAETMAWLQYARRFVKKTETDV